MLIPPLNTLGRSHLNRIIPESIGDGAGVSVFRGIGRGEEIFLARRVGEEDDRL